MPFTWEEIDRDWLAGDRLAAPSSAVEDALNRLEIAFGPEWVRSCHKGTGAIPTLPVAMRGHILASLEGLSNSDKLVEALRQHDVSAWAEATAIHIVRSFCPGAEIELFPSVRVGDHVRQPDFRVRTDQQEWTFIEVTRPDVAEEHNKIEALLQQIASCVAGVKKRFSLEVFLRRKPTDKETQDLIQRITSFCALEGLQSEAVPDGLGILTLNHSEPGMVVPIDHPGEPNCPRLGRATMIAGAEEPPRHIAVRVAYADERAKQFLNEEAKQLPKEYPGLIMIDPSRAPGGVVAWEPLLQRCFQPNQRTRVGAVCLFKSEMQTTEAGFSWFLATRLLTNPHAQLPLGNWLTNGLQTGRRDGFAQGNETGKVIVSA